MTFFYDLNKKLADLAKKQDLAESAQPVAERSTGDYSAKKAAAGKDIGKPGKMFSKIAKSAGKRYGSKESGERVAGAVLNKLRAKESVEEAKLQPTPELMKKVRVRLEQLHDEMEPEEAYEQMADELNITTRRLDQLLQDKRFFEADMEEGNEFSGELAQARAAGAKQFKVDGQSYPVKEGGTPMTPKQKSFAKLAPPANKITFADKIAGAKKEVDEMLGDVAAEAIKSAVGKKKESRSKGTAFDPEVAKSMFANKDEHPRYDVKDTGYSKRYTRKVQDEPKDDAEVSTEPKKKGRPKGPEKGPERVTKGSYKFKSGRPAKVDENDVDTTDRGEYDREGDMAKEQMHTIMSAAKELHGMLKDEENLPEWVQKKITLAKEYIDTARDYMATQHAERAEEEPIAEKAVSKKQQRFMGMVHAAQKGEKPASKEVAKVAKGMGKKDAEDFAKTKHKGLPEKAKKKDESVEETADAPKEKKSSGGYNFGGGVYESLDRKFQQALTEGMNVSVNMSTGQDGEPTKNITISADGEDADRLADLLKMAGLGGNQEQSCGSEMVDENSPDWPTNTETSDDAMQYSGGLNGPKSTGQTTTPVIASQLRRQVSMEEGVKIEQSLFKLYNQYKLK
jgi:hypothetical protein